MKKRNPAALLKKYLEGRVTPEERATVEKWYAEMDNSPIQQLQDMSHVSDQMYNDIRLTLDQHKIVPSYKKRIFRFMAAAASILLLIGIYKWHIISDPADLAGKKIVSSVTKIPVSDIESPSSVYAMLTLADGRKIRLDSAMNGPLALQQSAEVIKDADGRISYKPVGSGELTTEYNTLTVPRGSQIISLRLADGSLVVLNAASSITYPTIFSGSSRKVTITGEAYFEIAKHASMPFYVSHDSVSIKVLGTHFNVNSYQDEKNIAVTLLEGSVLIANGTAARVLKPGEQANINTVNKIAVEDDLDLDEVTAWKNGRFQFGEKADIRSIMRQISRWYDVDVEYRGVTDQQFWGSITRSANISNVLDMLEETGRVKFYIEGKKIIVTPVKI